MSSSVHQLLCRVYEVQARHRAQADAEGKRFQLFSLLGMERKEVKLHTPLLADLLSPSGSHGQGAIYLRLFLSRVAIADFNVESATLRPEYSLGAVTNESGGRLDLRLSDGKRVLMVENKIDAADGNNQLSRYREHDRYAHLIYLTLDGRKPGNVQTEAEMTRIGCIPISYAIHIRDWLKDCIEVTKPARVREVLCHYLDTVLSITNQCPDSMTDEIIQTILSSRETHEAFYAVRSQTEALKKELFRRLRADLDKMAADYDLRLVKCDGDSGGGDTGWMFGSEELSAHNLRIGFSFDKPDYQKLAFGFVKIDKAKPAPDGLLLAFKARSSYHSSNEWWPAWSYLEQPYGDWTRGSTVSWEALRTGEFAQELRRMLGLLLGIAKEALLPKES